VTIALDYTTVPELSNIGGLEYDCYNTTIYGYAWNDSAQEETFISIDPSTGVVTYVETIPNMKYVQSGESTLSGSDYFALMLDSQNNRFLVHISIANGFPVSTIALDYTNVPELSNIGGIEFDNNSGQIYGYAWNDSAQEETFISIDPSTGVVTYVETIPNMKYVQSGESTLSGSDYFALMLDSQNNRFLVHIGF
jgi:spermidine/putrescine-binding protein